MMGIECVSVNGRISRARTNIDTSILRSKTGHAILKGGHFYSRCLGKRLLQLNNDARVEIRIINYRQKLLLDKQHRRMKRSEQLVKTYNLPPLKSTGSKSTKITSDPVSTGHNITKCKQTIDTHRSQESRTNRPKTPTNLAISGRNYHSGEHASGEDIRRTICSPVPSNHEDDGRSHRIDTGNEIDCSTKMQELSISPAYPHITVERCEEILPPVHRVKSPTTPEYSFNKLESRSGSSNSLEVPSPIMQRRSVDGKMVTVSTPGNLYNNFSRSEGSIPDALKNESCTQDPRFTALEAVLRPSPVTKPRMRSPAKIDIEFNAGSSPKAVSPRKQGRLLRRDDERHQWRASQTPP